VGSIRTWFKKAAKWVLRPFARPFLNRFGAQQAQIDHLTHHLPILLNAISTQNATAREFERARQTFAAALADLQARMADHESGRAEQEARLGTFAEQVNDVASRGEFIRREVMYEARYGSRSRGVEHVEARAIDLSGIDKTKPLRLNLGSGHVPRRGFVNVDSRELDGVDVVSDVRALPFERGSVDEIYSAHLVEHFPLEELRRVVLPHWLDVLRPGGKLVAVTPDAQTMIEEAAAGRMTFNDLQRVTFGDQEYDGDFHFAMYTPDSFTGLLSEVGFTGVEIIERGRRNGLCYEFEIQAERPRANGPAPPGHDSEG
jgi:SAM-dependent methyltransferase